MILRRSFMSSVLSIFCFMPPYCLKYLLLRSMSKAPKHRYAHTVAQWKDNPLPLFQSQMQSCVDGRRAFFFFWMLGLLVDAGLKNYGGWVNGALHAKAAKCVGKMGIKKMCCSKKSEYISCWHAGEITVFSCFFSAEICSTRRSITQSCNWIWFLICLHFVDISCVAKLSSTSNDY